MALAAIGGGLSIFGSLLGAAGTYREGEVSAVMGEFNAQMSEQNAQLAVKQAAEEERRFRVAFRQHQGESRATVGASGVTMEGSPLEVLEQNARMGELDALTIRHQGEIRRIAHTVDAAVSRITGRESRFAAGLGVASNLLSGTSAGLSSFGKG